MKQRKKARRGEVPLPVEGVMREERSQPPLLALSTVVHKVETQTCSTLSCLTDDIMYLGRNTDYCFLCRLVCF